ncbi:adenylyltransferase/cytidyltransferase family protein [bacterium]|nr:MAG: adenylyltransferase/cytidyltransferase family protein [bacterium]
MIFNLYDQSDVELVREMYKDKTVGLTSGSFDIFHSAHLQYLLSCDRRCGHDGFLVVGVDSDQLVRDRKGAGRPIVPEADRLAIIEGVRCVSAAFTLETAEDFGYAAEILNADFIFKNQDYKNVEVYGIENTDAKLVIVPDFERTESTTALIDKITKLNRSK